jgi:alpha-beta hydrolase superfamily lysophospholipase
MQANNTANSALIDGAGFEDQVTLTQNAGFELYAHPVSFEGCTGIYHPADEAALTDTAVLFVSPWGMEELCTRKFQRVIAERLSAQGIASLRFDYPGTGDALDPEYLGVDIASSWEKSTISAASLLKSVSGCTRLVVIAQGLGCPVACEALAVKAGIDAMILMAPVISGRSYMRELAMWSSMIDDGLGLRADQRETGGGTIAGLHLPGPVAERLSKINLMKLAVKPAERCFVIARPGRVTETDLAAHFRSLGATVDEARFDGYDVLVSSPTLSRIPEDVVTAIANWLGAFATAVAPLSTRSDILPQAKQTGPGFWEQPVQFGEGGRLFGVFCEPQQQTSGAVVVFLNSAYDRHSGWGRLAVRMARELANDGIASLRFDTANVADSPAVEGAASQVLYDDVQNADVIAAIDFIEGKMPAKIVTVGRCSGAYLAFGSALADPRIRGVVAANLVVFRWQKGRSVDESLYKKPRSFGEYRQRFLQGATLTRLFKGEVDVISAATNICRALWKRIAIRTARLFRARSEEGRSVYGAFETLKANGTAVKLLYSENDDGLAHFGYYFDMSGRGLANYPNVSRDIIADADHNLSTPSAQKVYLDAVKDMALRF